MPSFLRQQKDTVEDIRSDTRIRIVSLGLFLFAMVIIWRLFVIEIMQHDFYKALATHRQEIDKELLPERGSIFIREEGKLFPLVTNQEYYVVYAEPNKIESPNRVIDVITPILGLEESEWKALLQRISQRTDPYEPIKRKVSKEKMEQIKAADLVGIGFTPEVYRYYPEKSVGGHIFGFVSGTQGEAKGQYGVEGYFQKELAGEAGFLKSIRDALGSLITIGPRQVQSAQDGADLVLTIDRKVQYATCQKLKFFHEYFKSKSATLIIQDPKTGAILTMCNFPDFDPEFYNKVEDITVFNNAAIFYAYEPGSVFKTFTMAAALDENKIKPDTTYDDPGEIKIGPYTIRNFDKQAHGVQTMTQVLEQSLNTGAMFAAEKVGKNKFRDYVRAFGFGEPTGITLATEMAGDLSSLDKSGDIFYLTASFGQGITATPLQLTSAYSAIANGGILLKPYIVSEIIKQDGSIAKTEPTKVRTVMSQKSASLLSGMLVSVVEKGYDKKANLEGYYFAGKTGTAQIADGSGGYGAQTNHTFIGYGPVNDPRFTIFIKLEAPQDIRYASDSVGPLFRQITEYLVDYYQIPPDY